MITDMGLFAWIQLQKVSHWQGNAVFPHIVDIEGTTPVATYATIYNDSYYLLRLGLLLLRLITKTLTVHLYVAIYTSGVVTIFDPSQQLLFCYWSN
jgi:hypothetical protein